MEAKEQKRKIFCRKCRQITNHVVLNKKEIYDNDEEAGIWVSIDYLTLECKGCETVCLVEEYTCSEDYDPEFDRLVPTVKIFPDPLTSRESISDSHYLPKQIRKIYEETINAFNRKLPILTSIGIRATIEAICIDNNITKGDLQKKIEKLKDLNLLTNKESELLHLTRFMGNAAAHELTEPLADELTAGIDILESVLQNAYILPEKASRLERFKKETKK